MAKVLTPPDTLKKLKCSSCTSYLSIFPIYIRRDGANPICGRCKVPNEGYIRDEAYEAIAQFLFFPCSEEKNGCIEQMTPLRLKDHEHICGMRKLDCPEKNFTLCKWSGPNKDLKTHFDAEHKKLVLAHRKFELNFLISSNEVVLMPFQDELFLIKKEMDTRTGTFICSCTHIILTENPEKFNYFLLLETSNSDYHKFSERSTDPTWEERTKFTTNEINDILNNPLAVVAVIEIVKAIPNGDKDKNDENNEVELDSEVLKSLECPVCLGYFYQPIYQCSSGHSICDHCRNKVSNRCPVCRATIAATRNFTLENFITEYKDLLYPCKYYKTGCSVLMKPSKIQEHENSCVYRPLDCPVMNEEDCQEEFTRAEIISHVDNNHDEYVLETDKINIPFNKMQQDQFGEFGEEFLEESLSKTYLIKFSSRLFKVCFEFSPDHKVFWAFQFFGTSEEECKKFKFEMVLVNDSTGKCQIVRGPCMLSSNNPDIFNDEANTPYIVWFTYDQISEYIFDDSLSFQVRILEKLN